MRKLLLTFLISLALFHCPAARALDLYVFGSYWDQEDIDESWGTGIGASLPLFTEHIRLDARGYIFENTDLGNDDELELIPLDLGLQFHLMPNASLDPYILGGVSYVYADADRIDIDSEFGAYAGIGADLDLISKLKLFGEVLYRSTELSVDEARSDQEIDVSGITANVGLKVHF